MTELGRNDPCPCGSGKKYKKCCGAKGAGRVIKAVDLTGSTASKMNAFFQNRQVQEPLPINAHMPGEKGPSKSDSESESSALENSSEEPKSEENQEQS